MVQSVTYFQRLREILKKHHRVLSQPKLTRGSKSSSGSTPPEAFSTSDANYLTISKNYDGKLLLRKEIALKDREFQELIQKGIFTPVTSIQRKNLNTICLRCLSRQKHLFGLFPCEVCKKEHLYCRNCIMMGLVSTCEPLYRYSGPAYPWPKVSASCSWDGSLSFAQAIASKRVKRAIERRERLLVWAVTGAGKTEILFQGIEYGLSQGLRICLASPRADVVRELFPRLQAAFQSIPIQALYGNSQTRNANAQLIIATTHQLMRFEAAFDLLIIDEIDAYPYEHDRALQDVAERAAKKVSSKIYLTATPKSNLKLQLYSKQLPYCFIPLRYHGHPLPVPKLLRERNLANQLKQLQLPSSFIEWIEGRKDPERQLLIFVPTISLAEKLVPVFAEYLLASNLIATSKRLSFVHAEDLDREVKVEQFRHKELQVLITTTILERGVTFPSIDVVVLQADHQVFDEAALVQIAGRAGRNAADPRGDVLFIYERKQRALIKAVHAIQMMNWRGKRLLASRKGVI